MATPIEIEQAKARERLYGGVPPFVLTGSEPKVGKSTDSIYCLPNAMFLYSDGGLKPAVSTVGWAPLDSDAESKTLTDAIVAITKRIKAGDPKKGLQFKNDAGQAMWGVVVDDFTLKSRAELKAIEANPPKSADGKVNKFGIWNKVNEQTYRIITICRELGMPAYLSSHLRDPSIDPETKEKIPGGPEMASGALSHGVTGWVDLIQYIVDDPTRVRWPHGLTVNTRGGNWLAGDRHNVVAAGLVGQPLTTPLNTAEILRAASYRVPRPVGMDDWMEPVVEYGVSQLRENKPESILFQEIAATARSVVPNVRDWQIVWLLRDIVDRHEIRSKSQRFNPLRAWGITT